MHKYAKLKSNKNIKSFAQLGTGVLLVNVQVVGVPDERLGEEICAWIRCKPQAELDSCDLRDFCMERVWTLYK